MIWRGPWDGVWDGQWEGSSQPLPEGFIRGSARISIGATAAPAAIAVAEGQATISVAGNGNAAAAVSLSGSAGLAIGASGNLSTDGPVVVWASGSATISLGGSGDLRDPEATVRRPGGGFSVRRQRPRVRRPVWNDDEVVALVAAILHSGCLDEDRSLSL